MNDSFRQWLDVRLSVPGMLACGIASPNDEAIGRSADPNFSIDQMAKVLQLLRNTPTAPDTESYTLKWRTWTFANGKIRTAIRSDGHLFAAAVLANSDADKILDPLTEEFLSTVTIQTL